MLSQKMLSVGYFDQTCQMENGFYHSVVVKMITVSYNYCNKNYKIKISIVRSKIFYYSGSH
jgi:hypothetical protein